MQLSDNTLAVLKNFSTLNPGLFFKKGNTLRTLSTSKAVLAEATVDETFPTDFGIHDLNQFLSVVSLFKDTPDLDIEGVNVTILGNKKRSKILYRCCEASMVKMPPDKNLSLPSQDITFTLTEDDFEWILKSSAVLMSPNIAIKSENGKLYAVIFDVADDSAASDTLELGDHTGAPVSVLFKRENWSMIPGTYTVTISTQGLALFVNQSRKLQYYVATEAKKK